MPVSRSIPRICVFVFKDYVVLQLFLSRFDSVCFVFFSSLASNGCGGCRGMAYGGILMTPLLVCIVPCYSSHAIPLVNGHFPNLVLAGKTAVERSFFLGLIQCRTG